MRQRTVFVVALLLAAAVGPTAADQRAIVLDGEFSDWRRIPLLAHDPRGDGADGGIDLGRLWAAHDGRYLYLRVAVGRETILQNGLTEADGSHLRLLLDWDGSAGTGLPVAGMGVDLEARLGERQMIEYQPNGSGRSLSPGIGRVVALPTHSASAFEIRVALPPAVRPDKKTGAGPRVRLLLVDEQQGGDRLPDTGTLAYRLAGAPVGPPVPIDLERKKPHHVRLLSLNVLDTSIDRVPDRYRRLLTAIAPDVISFQEVRGWSPDQVRELVAGVFPGRRWHAAGVNDCVTVSPFPIVASAAVDQNLLVHIDLPATAGPRDLVLFNVHLPCCDNDAGRDRESDNIAATWRDLLAGEGPFPIASDDAMVVLGDFNFVGYRRQLRVIRKGSFIDPSLEPDFSPGRASGQLRIARARHTHANTTTTWRRNGSAFAPGRLDFIFFTADALRHVKSLSLDTAEMDPAFRRGLSLRHGDSARISDHLPVVADFEVRARPAAAADRRGLSTEICRDAVPAPWPALLTRPLPQCRPCPHLLERTE